MRLVVAVLAIMLTFTFAGAAFAGGVQVEGAWARATIGTERPGVTYMTITNSAAESDRLLGASTPVAKRAQLHETVMENGVMKMRPAESIDIPPGGVVMLEPGGPHLMLTSRHKKLVEGQGFALTLRFEHGGEVTVRVAIAGLGAKRAPRPHDTKQRCD